MTLRRISLFTFTACALAFLCALQLLALVRAPAAFYPGVIAVTLRPGEAIVLGRQELAAPNADARHVGVRHDAQGAWWIRNASAGRALLLQSGHDEQRTGAATLQTGQAFQLGATRFIVDGVTATSLSFGAAGRHWNQEQ